LWKIFDGANSEINIDETLYNSGDTGNGLGDSYAIGSRTGVAGNCVEMEYSAFVVYEENKSPDKVGIQQNLNSLYTVY